MPQRGEKSVRQLRGEMAGVQDFIREMAAVRAGLDLERPLNADLLQAR